MHSLCCQTGVPPTRAIAPRLRQERISVRPRPCAVGLAPAPGAKPTINHYVRELLVTVPRCAKTVMPREKQQELASATITESLSARPCRISSGPGAASGVGAGSPAAGARLAAAHTSAVHAHMATPY